MGAGVALCSRYARSIGYAYREHRVSIDYPMGIHRVWIRYAYQSIQPVARKEGA